MIVAQLIDKKNNNIDLIRVIAALLVVWCHSFALTGQYGDPISNFLRVTYTGKLGVCIFFFLSGLLVTNSLLKKNSVKKYVLSRFFRIFPAYFTVIILSVFLIGPIFTDHSLTGYFLSTTTWNYLINNLLFDVQYNLPGLWDTHINSAVNGSLWSLPLEIGCYLFLLVSFLLFRSVHRPLIPILIFTVAVLLPNDFLCTKVLGVNYLLINREVLICFIIGSCFAIWQDKIDLNVRLVFALLLLCAMTWRYSHIISFIFPSTISIVLLFLFCQNPLLALKPQNDISYGLYIWHWPVIQMIISTTGLMNPYLMFMISFVITSVISLLSFKFLEKPFMNYGRTLSGLVKNKRFNYSNSLFVILLTIITILFAKFVL